MKTQGPLRLSVADKRSATKAAKRQVEIELGLRVPSHKVFKNKKAYSRRSKHRDALA